MSWLDDAKPVEEAPAQPSWLQHATPVEQPAWLQSATPVETSQSFGDMLREEGIPTSLDEAQAFAGKQGDKIVKSLKSQVKDLTAPYQSYEPTGLGDAIGHGLTSQLQSMSHIVPGMDALKLPAAGLAAATGTDEGKKIYEQITGKKYLTADEISALPTMEERDKAERDQSTLIHNIASNIKDLAVGLPRSAIAAVKGLDASANRGYDQGGVAGAVEEMAHDTARETGRLTLRVPEGMAEMAQDPSAAYQNPVNAFANASIGASAIKALAEPTLAGKAIGVARAISPIPLGKSAAQAAELDRLRPTNVATDLLQQATKDSPKLAAVAQWTMDARAGVPEEAQTALSDFERTTKGKTLDAQNVLKEATKGLSDAEKTTMRDVLTGEDTRAIRADWPEQVRALQPQLASLVQTGVATAEELKALANENPEALDNLLEQHLPNIARPMSVAELKDALNYRAAKTIDTATGEDLSSPGRVLLGGPDVNPANIITELNPFNRLSEAAAPLIDRINTIRQKFVEIGNEAKRVNAGRHPLLSDGTYNRNLAYYLPDIHDADVVKDPSQYFASFPKARGGPFIGTVLKNNLDFATRAALGATTDLDKANAIGAARAYNNIGKYDLFNTLANTPGLAKTPAEFAALSDAERARYRSAPLSTDAVAPGSPLKSYGALAGKHLDNRTYWLAKNMNQFMQDQNDVQKGIIRAGSLWKTVHTVLNPSTWSDIIMSNGVRALWMDGLMGLPNYAKEIVNQIRRGFGAATDKDYWQAAQRAGITSQDVFNLQEGAKAAGAIDAAGSVPKGLLNYVMGKKITGPIDAALTTGERIMKNNPVARAAAQGFMSVDNSMRMAAFKDFFKKQAERLGVKDPKTLLQDPELLKESFHHVEQYIPHMNYQNAPLALGYLDRYGALPFGRFAWRTLGAAADAATTNPNAFLSSVRGGKIAYDKMSPEDKRRIDIQPQYARGNMVPITPQSDLNASYYLPFGMPEDLVLGGRSGSAETVYKPGLENFFTREIGGPVGAMAKIIAGKNPLTDKDLFDNMGLFTRNTRSGEILRQMLPGAFYQGEKLVDAVEKNPDARGRLNDIPDALLNQIGIRVSPKTQQQAMAQAVQGFKARVADLKAQLKVDVITHRNNPEAQDEARQRFRDAVADARQTLKELRQPAR